jgi:hypothetical protein
MNHSVDRLLREALDLSADERGYLAAELLATLEPEPAGQGAENDWIAEIERRARAAIAGSRRCPGPRRAPRYSIASPTRRRGGGDRAGIP